MGVMEVPCGEPPSIGPASSHDRGTHSGRTLGRNFSKSGEIIPKHQSARVPIIFGKTAEIPCHR